MARKKSKSAAPQELDFASMYPGVDEDDAVQIHAAELLSGNEQLDGPDLEIALPSEPNPFNLQGDDFTMTEVANGDLIMDLAPQSGGMLLDEEQQVLHYSNLADYLPEAELSALAQDLIEKIDADFKSLEGWRTRIFEAMVLLGADPNSMSLENADEEVFPGASTAVHPMLAEAVVQFNARAMKELMPPGGPVKTTIKGDETDEVRDKAERIRYHMNYQIEYEDENYTDEMDQMLMYLPFSGSAFKKTYIDPLTQIVTSKFIHGTDVVCPYVAKTMESASRITHIFNESHNTLLKKQRSGYYRDTTMLTPSGAQQDTELGTEIKESEGRDPSIPYGDEEHKIYECHTNAVLSIDDDESGIALPYVITLDTESQTILAIYRNWAEGDAKQCRDLWFTHYKFLPGLGMYGYGYLHWIGGLVTATNGSMRALLDAAAFASLQGGFVAYDVKINKDDFTIEPGKYKPINIPSDELAKAFYTPSFNEPSQALYNLFKNLEETGRRFMSTVDVAVGDANNTGPVGTTVALIEQSTKVMSGVHQRLHRAQGKEFRIRAKLNARNLPDGGMYYDVKGGTKYISPSDYDENKIEIIPNSDPNVSSTTEKVAKAQALMERATARPDLYDPVEVESLFLDAIGISNKDEVLKKPDDGPYTSPMNEGALLVAGKAIKAFYEQNHAAHLAVHEAQMQFYQTLPPEQAQILMIKMQEHIAKHQAYKIHQEGFAMMGMPAPTLDLYASGSKAASLSPQVENAAAVTEAQQVQRLGALFAQMQPQPPEDAESKAKIERENAEAGAEEERKQVAFENEETRKQIGFETQLRQDIVEDAMRAKAMKNNPPQQSGRPA